VLTSIGLKLYNTVSFGMNSDNSCYRKGFTEKRPMQSLVNAYIFAILNNN
jgi:hypothetical protein